MSLTLAVVCLAVVIVAILGVPLLGPRRYGERRPAFDVGVYRDQLSEIDRDLERGLLSNDQAGQARAEIERRLLAADNRRRQGSGYHGGRKATATALLVAPLIPTAAVALYAALGTPDMPDMPYAQRPDVAPASSASAGMDVTQAIARLETRLLTSPDDAEGWALLGHSLITVGRFDDAHDALMRAFDLTGDPYIRADAAEARVSASGNTVDAAALDAFETLHATDPFEPKSRFYIGLAAAQAGRLEDAVQAWVDLIVVSPRDAPWLPTVRQQVLQAAEEAGLQTADLTPSAEALALAKQAASMPSPSAEAIEQAQEMSPEERLAFIRSMVERLAERLEANPDDREGWLRLARAYEVLGETEKAAEAMQRASAIP